MNDDSVPVYILRIGGCDDFDQLEDIKNALRDVKDRVGLDGEFIITTEDIEPIDKDELITALQGETDE